MYETQNCSFLKGAQSSEIIEKSFLLFFLRTVVDLEFLQSRGLGAANW